MRGFRGGGKNSKVREMSWTARKSIIIFNPHPTLWLGVLGLNISKRGERGRKGGRAEEGTSKGAGREEGRRKEGESKGGGGRGMEGGRDGGREVGKEEEREGWREEEGIGVRELEGRMERGQGGEREEGREGGGRYE